MNDENQRQLVLIVGGGLVGALNAIFFAKTNKFDVILCEKRNDIRNEARVVGRSINLAVSHRARSALKEVGLEEDIINSAIPMFARMIHERDGSLRRIPYGRDNQCIMAVDRRYLNEVLLANAEKSENVTIKFGHDLSTVNLKTKVATFSCSDDQEIEIKYDLLVGNDGAYSTVKQQMMKYMRLDFSQEYIPHGYMELYFPPRNNNEFSMHRNCLHIWPRNEFMLIGLPNPGGSFTGTLFMPFAIFDNLKSKEDLLSFFAENFPDALDLIGQSRLIETFFANKASSMVTIKCSPYNYMDSCVLMGDAAHAMVPFYGQGMNAGFEDVIIFHEILRQNGFCLDGSCSMFTEKRNMDAKTICDLAVFNYVEVLQCVCIISVMIPTKMRKTVNSRMFLLRKYFDNFMYRLFPSFWTPLYTLVTFTRTPYTTCMNERKKQDKILTIVGYASLVLLFGGFSLGFRLLRNYKMKTF